MGKCLFSPELKSYLITQWNCTTIGSCRCRKTNQWVGSGAARTYGDDTRQYSRRNGRGIWLYKRSFRHRILRFISTEATSRAATWHGKVRSTCSVSQGTEVTIVTEYVFISLLGTIYFNLIITFFIYVEVSTGQCSCSNYVFTIF